ncbi:MAG TPA: IS630 family transposase [Candidatus Tectomicrobia bacterium]
MWSRRQISAATVKALHTRLQQAYQHDDVRLVRRTMVLRNVLVYHVPVEVLCAQWGLISACIYGWRQAFLLRGMDSVVYRHGGGRRPKLTAKQKKRLVELREAGPLAVGCETGCWTSVLIRVLIWREFGVLSNGQYVCTLLHSLGFSLQKARVVSDHLDTATRLAWLAEQWPAIFRAATRCHGLILFEDEASCAQWGSLSYIWAWRGQQPEVKTSGKRQGDKVFGAREYFSGRLFSQGIEGRFTSDSYHAFLQTIVAHTKAHLFLIHDGARYHTSQATQQCLETHRERITASLLPSYSPDYHPIASLWKKTRKRAIHNQYFKEFTALTVSVDKALAYFATHPAMV